MIKRLTATFELFWCNINPFYVVKLLVKLNPTVERGIYELCVGVLFPFVQFRVLIGDVRDNSYTIVSLVCSHNVSIRRCLSHISLVTLITKHIDKLNDNIYYFLLPNYISMSKLEHFNSFYVFMCLTLCYYYILIRAE